VADIPAGRRDVVHPRRNGMIAVEPARTTGRTASARPGRLASPA